jgi:hypothetical protein
LGDRDAFVRRIAGKCFHQRGLADARFASDENQLTFPAIG